MQPIYTAYAWLAVAISSELVGTAFLQKSQQFTKLLPTLGMTGLYAVSFFCLSHALKVLPLGIAYALWGSLGIVFTAIIGVVLFRQSLDTAAIIGIGLIVVGVAVISVFSNSMSHG